MVESLVEVIAADGWIDTDSLQCAIYIGLQLTYSTTRFGLYEVVRQRLVKPGENMVLYEKVAAGGICGAAGGYVGTPADMINVRMQNDMKLPFDQRRK